MAYQTTNLISRQHGWGDASTGQSIGQTIGGLLQTLLGGGNQAPSAPVVVPAQPDHTMLYLGLAGAAGIGIYLYTRKKRK